MERLIERIGTSAFLQLAIESWNEIFLLILIAVMMVGIRHDHKDGLTAQVKIPLTNELVLFYAATFVYNLCNIVSICMERLTTTAAGHLMRICVFGYYGAGEFQTILFLQVVNKYIAGTSDNPRSKRCIFICKILQPMLLLLLIVTPFTNAIYRIDANNCYVRSWGYWVWQGVTILTFMFLGSVILAKWKRISAFLKHIITVTTVIPLLAMIASPFVSAFNLSNIMVAVTALITFLIYENNKNRIIIMNVNELERAKTDLAESRLTMMQAQIKPHFIYNSMNAIMELCYSDPELAAETIAHFSDYLRAKLDAFDSKELSWFDEELKLIKEYLSIEYADRNKVFRMEYDIACTDFRLPALTVQPLVENAVKHGIDRYSADSLVQLITFEDEHNIYIMVTDNGTAENGNDALFEESRGIGLRNVAERLKKQCGGDISVTHDEIGTSAVITIPKPEQEDV